MDAFDVWMCTHNSAKHLRQVLTSITNSIPPSVVNSKFIVDDFSTDNTCAIAEDLGWKVIHKVLVTIRRRDFSC